MGKNVLQQYFPMIRERSSVEKIIHGNAALQAVFGGWKQSQQEEFLDFCTGERGVKILYDSFFKEIFNPEYAPDRLEEFLSLIMKQTVKILKVLPNDSSRIADESSLLITDIVVELEDHSIANVEVQKIGYMFPGQRSACYSADLLLRQYKRLRGEKGKKFSYKHIQNVYTIVLFEHSTKEFALYPHEYIHNFVQKSDTGMEMKLLQEYYFIPLDIFRENIQNKGIRTKLDAWLVFLTSDEPEMILSLIEAFPEFKAMYEEIYELCRNVEDVMGLFSKELQELDRNTVLYMIDEMQEEIDTTKRVLEEKNKKLFESESEVEAQSKKLEAQSKKLEVQSAVQRLYEKLEREGRHEELLRAVREEAFRNSLMEEV